jgi:hypothetical protein
MKHLRYLFTIYLLVTLTSAFSQDTNNNDYYDIRIKKLLDSKQVNYTINKYNDFKINFITEKDPKERTQYVTLVSKTTKYEGYEIRELRSTALKIKKTDIKLKVLSDLLITNSNRKIGAWEIDEYSDDQDYYYLLYSIKSSTNISADDLYSLAYYVAFEADRIEKLYGSGLDEW